MILPVAGLGPLTPFETRQIKARLLTALCRHGEVDVYWVPVLRDITTRAVATKDGRVRRALRADAVHVGRYRHLCNAADVLGDIDALLSSQRRQLARCAA